LADGNAVRDLQGLTRVIQLNRKIRTVGHVLGELRLGTLLQR
jgi:hypothetical protein